MDTHPHSVGEAERLLNTLLFVPLGAAIALLLARRVWPIAILVGFAFAGHRRVRRVVRQT
jgi:glycopeptide antibiotics resistance protein